MYNIRRGSNLRFSDHMSSLKTALRSSDTCLILDFSTTRSSSTFWRSLRKFWIQWDDVKSYGEREDSHQWSRVLWDLESDLGLFPHPLKTFVVLRWVILDFYTARLSSITVHENCEEVLSDERCYLFQDWDLRWFLFCCPPIATVWRTQNLYHNNHPCHKNVMMTEQALKIPMPTVTLSILTLSRPMSISAFSLLVSAITNFVISSWPSSWW